MTMTMTLPNKLTLIRIAMIPVFIVLFYIPLFGINNYLLTGLFILAGLTDWFDGYLARRLKMQSEFGAFLDPVADKLMVSMVLVLLVSAHPGWLLAIPATVIIGRELTISALREWMAKVGERLAEVARFRLRRDRELAIEIGQGHAIDPENEV